MLNNHNYLSDPYTEVYDCTPQIEPLALIDKVIDLSFSLPDKEIQRPIMKCCIIANSVYSAILPLVVCYGSTGTGKSQLGKLVAGLYQLPSNYLLAGKTTATAIRNLIQTQKFGDDWQESECDEEEKAIIVWDDINNDVLRDPVLLSILKSGYSRKTATIAIASAGGTNLYFNCFALKFTSTIHPFWALGEYIELQRRILIFPHGYYQDFSEQDKAENKEPGELIDLDYVSFDGYKEMDSFVPDTMEHIELGKIRRSLKQRLRYSGIPNDFGKLCFDLMCIGCLWKVFPDTSHCITAFEQFWTLQNKALKEKTEFDYWLDRYLIDVIERESKLPQVLMHNEPITIPRSKLQIAIDTGIRANEIPNSRYDLAQVMRLRGWKLNGDSTNTFTKHV